MKIQSEGERLQITGLRELDSSNANVVREQVLQALSETHKNIDIDLSEATLVDSCGLGALLSLQRKCAPRKMTLRLLNPTSQMQQFLELTRMQHVFEIIK
jgi:anti-sigma B factor antagonist